MAGCTVDRRSDVRSVVETNVSFLDPAVDALPGNVFTTLLVGAQLLDFRVIRQRIYVARPAGADVWNPRNRTPRHGDVAVRTLHLHFGNMLGMDESDGLLNTAAHSEKMAYGFKDGVMPGREHLATRGLLLPGLTTKGPNEHERKNPYRHSPEQHSGLAQIPNLLLCGHFFEFWLIVLQKNCYRRGSATLPGGNLLIPEPSIR